MYRSEAMRPAGIAFVLALCFVAPAHAQDVRGLEVCTAEKQMDRRTSCLQSNVDFLQQTIDKNAREARQALTAANAQLAATSAQIAASNKEIAALRESVTKMQAAMEMAKKDKTEKTDKK